MFLLGSHLSHPHVPPCRAFFSLPLNSPYLNIPLCQKAKLWPPVWLNQLLHWQLVLCPGPHPIPVMRPHQLRTTQMSWPHNAPTPMWSATRISPPTHCCVLLFICMKSTPPPIGSTIIIKLLDHLGRLPGHSPRPRLSVVYPLPKITMEFIPFPLTETLPTNPPARWLHRRI